MIKTVKVFINVLAKCSSPTSMSPLNSDLRHALKHIDVESGVKVTCFSPTLKIGLASFVALALQATIFQRAYFIDSPTELYYFEIESPLLY